MIYMLISILANPLENPSRVDQGEQEGEEEQVEDWRWVSRKMLPNHASRSSKERNQ